MIRQVAPNCFPVWITGSKFLHSPVPGVCYPYIVVLVDKHTVWIIQLVSAITRTVAACNGNTLPCGTTLCNWFSVNPPFNFFGSNSVDIRRKDASGTRVSGNFYTVLCMAFSANTNKKNTDR